MSENCDEAARKAAVAKTERSTALGTFTRASNMLTKVLEEESTSENVLREQFDDFLDCWDKLEEAHGNYLETAEVEDDEYLKDLEESMVAVYVRCNDRMIDLKERNAAEERRKRFVEVKVEAEKIKFYDRGENFKEIAG